jgi:ATP/maltotriose-dependent transcriptional regulator MalT
VLDDYQFIKSQAVHEGVTFLLEHCPNTLHMVIATPCCLNAT